MKILGIWDGHDSGAALVEGNKILFSVNEERFTRRKLEIDFPVRSIDSCLKNTNTSYKDISEIAISTSDFAKTLTRVFPKIKEEYYLIRRRKKFKNISFLKKKIKYKLTEYPPSFITKNITRLVIEKKLRQLGFKKFRLHIFNHHFCHVMPALTCSDFKECIILSLDGLGDGLSGSIYLYKEGILKKISSIPSRHSLGIFFEHVTNIMNMRELEDEGKVMALANYAFPIDDNLNPLNKLIKIKDLSIKCRYPSLKMYNELKKIYWQYPSEQFAYMAQRTLEVKVLNLILNSIKKTCVHNICLSGGIFSNVKLNRIIRNLPEINKCFVFPHMGDGGLAIGAAIAANFKLNSITKINLNNIFLGPEYSNNVVERSLKRNKLVYSKSANIVKDSAKLIVDGEIIFWFQGSMELGPRALGGRSIIARPDLEYIKDKLNIRLKKRVWYQPFCPSMLEDDAKDILEDYENNKNNSFMTMAYMVKDNKKNKVKGIINIDGSCRPQIVKKENTLFWNLLKEVKKLTGFGIVLNTSYNVHGEPLVCSPEDAINTFIKTNNKYLIINDYIVINE